MVGQEVEQSRHPLEIRRHAGGVTLEVKIVELEEDDVLKRTGGGGEGALGIRVRRPLSAKCGREQRSAHNHCPQFPFHGSLLVSTMRVVCM